MMSKLIDGFLLAANLAALIGIALLILAILLPL